MRLYRQGAARFKPRLSIPDLSHSLGVEENQKTTFRMKSLGLRLGISLTPRLPLGTLLHIEFVSMFLLSYMFIKPGREPSTARW